MITTSAALVGALLVIASIPDAACYTKYGRTCKDIGCRSDEICVMAEDPCLINQRDNCGRYPTCTKATQGPSCRSMICGENQDCRTEDGVPKCVNRITGNVPARSHGRFAPRPTPPTPPTPPPRSSSFGGRYNGVSGSRNSIGSGSIFSRLFGDDRGSRAQVTTTRPRSSYGNAGHYQTHTSVDAHGNRVWTFSG